MTDWYDLSGMDMETFDLHLDWIREQPEIIRADLLAFADEAAHLRWSGSRARHFQRMVEHDLLGALRTVEVAFAGAADVVAEQGRQQRNASAPVAFMASPNPIVERPEGAT